MGQIGFWSQYVAYMKCFLEPDYQVSYEATSFEWGADQAAALQQIQTMLQGTLDTLPYKNTQWQRTVHNKIML